MNPMTNMKNVIKLSEQELHSHGKSSWHDQYRDSAWIFVGGLPYDLTEGDIICIFSQYGEIVNINLIRAKDTGKSKGFCFLCYEDQRSTVLAVDNFNGIKILNRTIRVDHVSEYKIPKENRKTDEETKKLYQEGCAPKSQPIIQRPKTPPQDFRETIADQIENDIKLPQRLPIYPIKQEPGVVIKKEKKEKKKHKKEKKSKKSKKSKKRSSSSSDSNNSSIEDSEREEEPVEMKKERRNRSRSRSNSRSQYNKDKRYSKRNRSRSRSRDRQSSTLSKRRRSRSRSPKRR